MKNITLDQIVAAISQLQSDPRFVKFSPPLEKQLTGMASGTWGNLIMADFDVSGGCGQAFSPFSVKISEK